MDRIGETNGELQSKARTEKPYRADGKSSQSSSQSDLCGIDQIDMNAVRHPIDQGAPTDNTDRHIGRGFYPPTRLPLPDSIFDFLFDPKHYQLGSARSLPRRLTARRRGGATIPLYPGSTDRLTTS